jgi:hypothetical protein
MIKFLFDWLKRVFRVDLPVWTTEMGHEDDLGGACR